MGVSVLKYSASSDELITVTPLPRWKVMLQEKASILSRNPAAHRVLSALLLFGAPGIGAYAHWVEPTWLKVRRLTLPLYRLPMEFDGFRIVHLSDLHMGSTVPSEFLQHVMQTVQKLAPDLVVLTGDFVHTKPDEVAELTTLLRHLQAPSGVFAVLGNHDYGANYPGDSRLLGVEDVVITALERAGITVLRNDWVPITAGAHRFALMGVDELWSGQASVAPLRTVPTAYSRVVLCHNPDVFSFLPAQNFDLLLCGHTHGGQVRLPPFPPLLTATTNRRLWGGLTAHEHSWVFVSRGIGYTWRVRFASRPECVEITLKKS